MVAVVNDPQLEQDLIAQRQRTGADRYDEVWEGVYMMAPLANNEHQEFVLMMSSVLDSVVRVPGCGRVFPGVNVSDRTGDWKENYRCPDVAVFLNGTQAEDRDSFWFGGPDFAIEIVSPNDRTREKLDFYAKVKTQELLIVDRDPWQLELYRLHERALREVGRSTAEAPEILTSAVVPLTWQLRSGDPRPQICIKQIGGSAEWVI